MSVPRLRALVVDDEPLARDELTFLLNETEEAEVVAQAKDAEEALALASEHAIDVVFVDLRMPGPDGIAVAEAILRRHEGVAVVVVSAHDDGALRAFEASVTDYLLKPVRLERLRRSLDRVRRQIEARGGRPGEEPLTRLAVRRKNGFVVLDVQDVVYFEMRDELVWAVTEDDRFALDLTLSSVEQRLPEGFFRSHRGALVRLDRIRTIEPAGSGTYELLLRHPDSPRVPLARERARTLRTLIPVAG
ncbi:MAG: LytTR family DNA-binding domain-containing protein [Myxococcota bacterium]